MLSIFSCTFCLSVLKAFAFYFKAYIYIHLGLQATCIYLSDFYNNLVIFREKLSLPSLKNEKIVIKSLDHRISECQVES